MFTIRCWPCPPLRAVNWTEIAVLVSPLVPDMNSAFLQPVHVGIATQKPNQLAEDTFGKELFGGK